jgi:hypothetical protein
MFQYVSIENATHATHPIILDTLGHTISEDCWIWPIQFVCVLWRKPCEGHFVQQGAIKDQPGTQLLPIICLILQSYPHQTIPDPHLMGRGYCIISIWRILRRVSPKFAGSLHVRVFYSIYTVYIHYTCSQYNIYIHYIYYIYYIYIFIYLSPYLFPFQIPSFLLCSHGCLSQQPPAPSPRSHKSRRTHLHDPRGTELLIAGVTPEMNRGPWWRHRPWYMTWIQQGHSWMWLAQSKCTCTFQWLYIIVHHQILDPKNFIPAGVLDTDPVGGTHHHISPTAHKIAGNAASGNGTSPGMGLPTYPG